MRKLLLPLLIVFSVAAQAQPFSDSIETTVQRTAMYNSTHGRLCHIINYDVSWANNISVYLQENGYKYQEQAQPLNTMVAKLNCVKPDRMGKRYLLITAKYGKDNKTKSLTITGTADELAELFVYYWQSHISINKLKSGGYFYQDYGTDRITFDWKGKQPVIRIMNNPDASHLTIK